MFAESRAIQGSAAMVREIEVALWSPKSPMLVAFELADEQDDLTAEKAIEEAAAALPKVWPAILNELLAMTGAKEAWKLIPNLSALHVVLKPTISRWTVQAEFRGRWAGTSFFVDLEGDRVVRADAAD